METTPWYTRLNWKNIAIFVPTGLIGGYVGYRAGCKSTALCTAVGTGVGVGVGIGGILLWDKVIKPKFLQGLNTNKISYAGR